MKRVFCILMLLLMVVMVSVPFVALAVDDPVPTQTVDAVPTEPFSWQTLFSTLLYGMATAAAPVLFAGLYQLIVAARKKVWGEKYGTEIQMGVSAATDMVFAAVVAINQEYVDALKGKNIFDEVAQDEARARAKEKALELITDVSKAAVETLYGSFEKWLDLVLEKAVVDAKNAKAAATNVVLEAVPTETT